MEEATKFIREVGFPVAVAIFVLWRVEGAINALTTTIARLHMALVARGIIREDPPSKT